MTALCIFAGASSGNKQLYIDQAAELSKGWPDAARSGLWGGRSGLMGAFADGSGKRRRSGHRHYPEISGKSRDQGHKDASQLIITNSMHERKARMYQGASAFVILPGGLGTLDETMEVMTWIQLGLLKGRDIYSESG